MVLSFIDSLLFVCKLFEISVLSAMEKCESTFVTINLIKVPYIISQQYLRNIFSLRQI